MADPSSSFQQQLQDGEIEFGEPGLVDDLKQIKASLYAQYQPQIESMMREAREKKLQSRSPAEVRRDRLNESIEQFKPLRDEIHKVQMESIALLVREANEALERGEKVDEKLRELLKIKPGKS